MEKRVLRGAAFILEGDTEKIFYLALLEYLCKKHSGWRLEKEFDPKTGEVRYFLESEEERTLIKLFVVGTISQLTNSAQWFEKSCHKLFSSVKWTVFLCYDTDSYASPITKFYEGDWDELRKSLSKSRAEQIIDLAAQADIEDMMLLDSDSVFRFLNMEPCEIPSGAKGKRRMKKLFRMKGPGVAYHEGNRAADLIQALHFEVILERSPLRLDRVEELLFSEEEFSS